MRPNEMDVSRAVQDLEENGSSEDPIWFRGKETTPNRLEHTLSRVSCWAKDVSIGYYGGVNLHMIKRGTLSGMVADRRRLRERRDEVPKQRTVRAILKDIIIAFELEFHDDGRVACIAYPKEVRDLAAEAHRKLRL